MIFPTSGEPDCSILQTIRCSHSDCNSSALLKTYLGHALITMAPETVHDTLDLLGSLIQHLGPSRVLTSKDPSYRLHSEPYAIQKQRNPHVVLVPDSAEALAKIMRVLYHSDLDFAVRGHGFKSASAKHVIISMLDFKEFAYDSKDKIATVGAGATWAEVVDHMERVDPGYSGKHSKNHDTDP